MSLAIKGQSPFAVGLGASGSRLLSLGVDGFPSDLGETTYEAVVGDAAARAEVVVTVLAKRTPTPADPPTIRLSGAGSCYPVKTGDVGCNVSVIATATNYTSISWGGCCSGSGTSASCHVANLADFDCTATATGAGGTATARHTVAGVNDAPYIQGGTWSASPNPAACETPVTFTFQVDDEEKIKSCTVRLDNVGTQFISKTCPAGGNLTGQVKIRTWGPGKDPGGLNHAHVTVTDPWGEASNERSMSVYVNACP